MRINLSILFLSLCYGNIINVPADSLTIQAGINGAQTGDTVLVSAETYVENIIWPPTNGIKLICSGEEYCIIDGGGIDSSKSVIRFEEDLGGIIDASTLIKKFTIRKGYAQDYPHDSGGGIYLYSSSPAIDSVIINGNTANFGGGMLLEESSNPTLTNVMVSGNTADFNGGGMYLYSSSNPDLMDVIISDNTASYYGGGMYLNSSSSALTLTNVIISRNTATDNGGGMYLNSSSPTLTNVTISGNTTADNGGGMYLYSSSNPDLMNVIIANNTAADYGGGMYLYSSSPELTNVTISANTATDLGAGMYLYSSSTSVLVNSILWDDENPQEIYIESGSVTATYSDIQGGFEGETNIDADPLFTDPDNGDFTLQSTSPCIDAGDPASAPDPDCTIADMGAYYLHQCPYSLGDMNVDEGWNVLDIVLLINCVLDDNCDTAFGCISCAGDINDDGSFGIQDIVILIACVLDDNCQEALGTDDD